MLEVLWMGGDNKLRRLVSNLLVTNKRVFRIAVNYVRFLHVQNFSFEPIALSLLCRLMNSKFLQCLLIRTATTLFVTLLHFY